MSIKTARMPIATTTIVLSAWFFLPSSSAGAATYPVSACSWRESQVGLCSSSDGVVTIGDTETNGGGGTPSEEGGVGSGDPGASSGGATAEPSPWDICNSTPGPRSAACRSLRPVGVVIGGPAPATPGWSVTVSDLARFAPSTATVAGEPDNIAIVGLPANFLSSAKTETIPGTILGRALMIRFTPVSFTFDYGDGEQRMSTTPGTAWDASGQAQFTPTDTSHVYKEPGTYTVSAIVTYSADIDLGTGWIPINGQLNGSHASQQIRVMKARTALVQNTCTERPGAPGC